MQDKNPITFFAVTNYRDIRKKFSIKEKNHRGHIYIVGKTGTGKSTLMQNMVISDVNDNKDFKGEVFKAQKRGEKRDSLKGLC